MASQPEIIWTDSNGDHLALSPAWNHLSVSSSGGTGIVSLPTDHDDKVTVAAAFVDALGLEPCEGGFRAKPRPFRVGDVVRCNNGPAFTAFTVLHVGSERLFVVAEDAHEYAIEHHRCTLITPAEEVEQGEVEQSEGEWRTPEEHELADAKRAGVLQIDDGTDDWPESCRSPEDFELHGFDGYLRSAYRVPAGWNR